MKLNKYFEQERIDPLAFAVASGISIATIYRYLKGSKPNRRMAYKIEKLTRGKVSVEDLLPITEEAL